jgi:hypothetical protein
MKFMKPLASTLFLGLFVAGGTASADPAQVTAVKMAPLSPMVARPAGYKFQVTMIKGDVQTIPASQFTGSGYGSGSMLSGFQCSNLTIVATSTATKPRPPGHQGFWPPQPIWQRVDVASGNWASGKCQYSLIVPGGESFRLSAGNTGGNFECHYVSIGLTEVTGGQDGQSVPSNTVKTDNVKITDVVCGIIG